MLCSARRTGKPVSDSSSGQVFPSELLGEDEADVPGISFTAKVCAPEHTHLLRSRRSQAPRSETPTSTEVYVPVWA